MTLRLDLAKVMNVTDSPRDATPALPWRAILDHTSVALAVLDAAGHYVYANRALCDLLGRDPAELLGRNAQDTGGPVLGPESFDSPESYNHAAAATKTVAKRCYVRPDGSMISLRVVGSVIRDITGRCWFVSELHDITPQPDSETRWQRAFDSSPSGMAVLDMRGHWMRVNDALCRLLGYERAELIGKDDGELTYGEDQGRDAGALAHLADGRQETVTTRKLYRHRDGYPLWVAIRSSAVPGPDGHPVRVISHYDEIGNGRMADEHLAHLALHDPLTGLANRALLTDRLEHQLAEIGRTGELVVVLVADIDELKPVNDRFGHAAGDRLLTTAAHQLLTAVRTGDTVARIGGDEFVVASIVADDLAADRLRERIRRHLDTEVLAWGHRLRLGASVGMATTKDPSTVGWQMVHEADRIMYREKRRHQPRRP